MLDRQVSASKDARHEKIYLTHYNFVRNIERVFIICAKPSQLTRDCIGCERGPTSGSSRPAESAGDDETDDRAVEAE